MSKRQLIIIGGVWVMAFLFLGFPNENWDKILALITGGALIAVAYSMKPADSGAGSGRSTATSNSSSEKVMPYVEHRNEPVRPTQSVNSADQSADQAN